MESDQSLMGYIFTIEQLEKASIARTPASSLIGGAISTELRALESGPVPWLYDFLCKEQIMIKMLLVICRKIRQVAASYPLLNVNCAAPVLILGVKFLTGGVKPPWQVRRKLADQSHACGRNEQPNTSRSKCLDFRADV
jgi:hypothetical protein